MKHKILFVLGLPLFFSSSALGQATEETPSPCLISSLNLSTGYNPQTTSFYNNGDTDPRWKITYISPDLYADASGFVPVGSGAKIVAAHPLWSQNSQCRYLSAISNNYYTTQPNKTYRTHLERSFTVCSADTFAFQFDYAADDTLALYIDGVFQFKTAVVHLSNNNQVTLPLSAGTHTVKGVLMNGDLGYPGYYGGRVAATVTSVSNRNTLVSESSVCGDYVCNKTTSIESVNGEGFTFQVAPNPASSAVKLHFRSPLAIREGRIQITALDGRVVFEKIVSGKENAMEIPVSGWPSGLYQVVLSFEGERHMTRLVVP